MMAPRPGLPRDKSGTIDISDGYSRKMIAWRDSVMRQAAAERQADLEFQEIDRYIDYLSGNWYDPNRPAYKSRFYDNYMADARREALSSLSDIRPAMDISCRVKEYRKQAEIAHNCVRDAWIEQRMERKLVRWIDHSLFGSGFWKMVAYMPGEIAINALGADSVFPIMMGEDGELQSAQAVVYRGYRPLSYFVSTFGKEKSSGLDRYAMNLATSTQGDKYARPNDIPEYAWNSMGPAIRRHKAMRGGMARGPMTQASLEANPFPVIELIEIYSDDPSVNELDYEVRMKHPDLSIEEHNFHYIVPPGRRLFPRKRLSVFAGDRVMYDGPSPFWHGLYPFIMLQLNPSVWSPNGISKYRDLVPLILSINRVGGGIDDSIVQGLNRNLVTRRGAMDMATYDRLDPSKPAQKILLNAIADPSRDVKWMEPPIVPAASGDWLRYLVDDVRRRSGSLDITGLARKKQAPGGDTIENMRDAMSAPFRLEARYVEDALVEAARQAVSNVFQFYTHDRRLRLLGEDGQTWEDYDYKASDMVPAFSPREDHWKLFPVRVAPGSMHGTSKFMKKQEAYILRRQRDLSLKGLYRQIEINENPETIMAELKEESEMGMVPPKGRTPRQTRSQKTGGII